MYEAKNELEKAGKGILFQSVQEEAQPCNKSISAGETRVSFLSDPGNCKVINLCCFKSRNLQECVRGAIEINTSSSIGQHEP